MAGQSEQWRCGVEELEVELRRRRLRWFGHVARVEEGSVLRLAEVLQVGGRRPLGRPKKTWRRRIQEDMDSLRLAEGMAQDRREWRRFIRISNPIVLGEDGLKTKMMMIQSDKQVE
jgi:hypothetical protein